MNTRARHELTPAEEAFFERNPELGKAMEALRNEDAYRRIERHQLKAELHLAESGRILDKLKRELGI